MKSRIFILGVFISVIGCIGVDQLEDPLVNERIEVTPTHVALMPTQSSQIMAAYINGYGMEEEADFAWISSDPQIASVDENGVISALGVGQTSITASYKSVVSEAVNVTVVEDANAIASVEITSPKMMLNVGEKVNLTAIIKNIFGETLTGRSVEWFSENSSIVSVTDQGEVTALSSGLAGVHAKSENVKSNSIEFVIGSSRAGVFVPAGGYSAEGMAALRTADGNVILELGDNFKTSFALGTFVYLSNSTSGSATFSNGLELAQITTNGAKTFNVTSIDPDVGLFDYRYVIILCKPARVTFGYADLQ